MQISSYEVIQIVLSLVLIHSVLWFLLSILLKRNDIADIAWGLSFILIVWGISIKDGYSLISSNPNFILIRCFTTLWGIRLTLHIFSRNKNKKEDYRYKQWRDEWGKLFYLKSYLQVFLLQGLFAIVISTSAILAYLYPSKLSILSFLGLFVWVLGFFFESVGDYQLSQSIKNPNNKGKIIKTGLWRYTRHPNYFGEVIQWWGIFLISLNSMYGYLAIISPLLISFLILKVSGIPMLEKKYDDNLEFQEYKRTTNTFFPWFPKK